MSKKILSLILVVMLVGVFAIGCSSTEPATDATEDSTNTEETTEETTEALPGEGITIGMITDTGGLGDQSFNDSAYAGLLKAEEDFGTTTKVLESASADDYGPNLTAFSEEQADLIIGVGFLFDESLKQVGEIFPEQKYAGVDTTVEADNIVSLKFAEHEGSFLVGVIAGMTTETNKVGFIGGMQFPTIEKFEYGFRAGVMSVNPDCEVIVNYADSFTDSAKGKEIALVQNQAGADVIFHAAGGVGIGLIQAAGEKDFWAIGVDQDQSAVDPEHVLCSMIKRVDTATYIITQEVIEGTYKGGIQEFNIANDGVGYSDNANNLTDAQKEMADKYKAAIAAGQFVVPQTADELAEFEVPVVE